MTISVENWESFAWFVVINATLLLAIALRISYMRIFQRILYGDGGDKQMQNTIRAHANGIEHMPLFALLCLILMGLGGHAMLDRLMILFTIARFSHAYGMCFRYFNARRIGATFTYLCQSVAIILIVVGLTS